MHIPSKLAAALVGGGLVLGALACGGGGGGGGSTSATAKAPVISAFAAGKTSLLFGESTQLSATYDSGVGTVDQGVGPLVSGTPVTVSPVQDTTYTLTVSNTAGSDRKSVTVSVAKPSISAVSPASVNVAPGGTTTFSASVAGASNGGITWTASGGSVAQDGTWTAPVAPGTYTVTATSQALASLSASATATVVAPPPAPVVGGLATSTTTPAYGQTFTLVSSFSGGNGVIDNGVGAVTSGVPTAPITANWSGTRTYTLTVTNSAGDTATNSATVTPQSVVVALVSPVAPTVTVGDSLTFSASASGGAQNQLTWTASGGTIAQTGLWTAPSAPGTYTITATSVDDPSKSASANVTVVAAPTASLTAAAGTVTRGTGTTVTPTFSGGTAVIGTTGAGSSDLSASATSGASVLTGNLAATTTVTLTVTNAAGTRATASTVVSVVSAPTASITASTSTPLYGGTVVLTPTFASGTAVVGTTQGGSDVSASATSGTGITTPALTAPATYWIRTTNPAGDHADASVTVTPQSPVVSAVTPVNPQVVAGHTQIFTATISGATDTSMVWSATGGTIDAAGLWTAPATAGTYTITATSKADPTKTATTTATVGIQPAISGVQVPVISALYGDSVVVTPTFSGGTGLIAPGAIPAVSGQPVTLPNVTTGAYTLTVTSSDALGLQATQAFSVPVQTVAVSPYGTNILTVPCGAQQVVQATISGALDPTITWSVSGGALATYTGSLPAPAVGKVWTAPATPGTYTITATSAADPTQAYTYSMTAVDGLVPNSVAVGPSPLSGYPSFAAYFPAGYATIRPTADPSTWDLYSEIGSSSLSPSYRYGTGRSVVSGVMHATGQADTSIPSWRQSGTVYIPNQTALLNVDAATTALQIVATDDLGQSSPLNIAVHVGTKPKLTGPWATGLRKLRVLATDNPTWTWDRGSWSDFGNFQKYLRVGTSTATMTLIADGDVISAPNLPPYTAADADAGTTPTSYYLGIASQHVSQAVPMARETTQVVPSWVRDAGTWQPASGLPIGGRMLALSDGRAVRWGCSSWDVLLSGGALQAIPEVGVWSPSAPISSAWTTLATLPAPWTDQAAVEVGGRLLLIGGRDSANQPQAQVQSIDLVTGAMSVLGNLAQARATAGAVLLPSGKVLVVGGGTNAAELLDPVTGSSTVVAPAPTLRGETAAYLLPDGRVVVLGGSAVDTYSPTTDTWTTAALAGDHSVHFASCQLTDGRVAISGGLDSTGQVASNLLELLDPATGTWSTSVLPTQYAVGIGIPETGLWCHQMAQLGSRICIWDGRVTAPNSGWTALSCRVEFFDLATGTWAQRSQGGVLAGNPSTAVYAEFPGCALRGGGVLAADMPVEPNSSLSVVMGF